MLSFFKPPTFADADKNRTAYLVHVVTWGMVIAFLIYILLVPWFDPPRFGRYFGQFIFGIGAMGVALFLNRRGFITWAGGAIVGLLWLLTTYAVFTRGGVEHYGYAAYLIVTLIAGFLMGGRIAAGVAILSTLVGLGLVYGAGQLPAPDASPSVLVMWVTYTLMLSITVLLQSLGKRSLRLALGQVQHELNERRQAETTLQAREIQLRTLLDNLPDLITRYDTRLYCTYVNPTVLELYNLSPADFIGRRRPNIALPAEVADLWETKVLEVFATGKRVEFEFKLPLPSGTSIAYETRLVPEFAKDGTVTSVLGISRDVTARNNAHTLLRQSEMLYRRAIEAAGAVPYYLDHATASFTFMGANIQQLTDYSAQEITPALFETLIQDPALQEAAATEHLRGTTPLNPPTSTAEKMREHRRDFRILTRTGQTRWLSHATVDLLDETNGLVGTIGILQDITQRKQAETALRESELLYRRAIEAADAVPYYHDYSTNAYSFIGEGIEQLTGYTARQMTPSLLVGLIQETYVMGDATHLPRGGAWHQTRTGRLNRKSDIRLKTRTGEVRWLSDASVEIMDDRGRSMGAVGVLQDVTERREAEEKIIQLNERLEQRVAERTAELEKLYSELEQISQLQAAILESAPYMILATDVQGRVQVFNQLAENQLGLRASDLLGQELPMALFEPRTVVRRAKALTQELGYPVRPGPEVLWAKTRHNAVDHQEWLVRRHDGAWFPMSSSVVAIRNNEGQITGFLGMAADVTERKRNEEALRASEEKFRALTENNPLQITRYNASYECLYSNPAGLRISGFDPATAVGQTLRTLMQDELVAAFGEQCLQQVFTTGEPYHTEYQFGDRVLAWWLAPEFNRAGRVVSVITTTMDITDRKRAEEALRASEEKFRALANNNPLAIARYDRQYRYLYANTQAAQRAQAETPEAILGCSDRDLFGAVEMVLHAEQELNEVFNWGLPQHSEFSFAERIYERWVAPEFDANNHVLSVITTSMDVTERRHIEQQLRESEARFRAMSDASPLGLFVDDPSGQCVYVNTAYLAIIGLSMEEALGSGWMRAIHPEDQEFALTRWENARQQRLFHENVYRFLHSDGTEIWVSGKVAPMWDGATLLGFVGTMEDITDRVQTEEALRQRSEELEAANAALAKAARHKDEFLASMSHELRTPLTGILALSEALQRQVYGPLTDKQRKSLQSIEESGRHLLELINDILDLSKIEAGKMELQLETINIEDVCQASLRLIRQIAQAKKHNVAYTINPVGLRLRADNRRLKQMLVNLLSNAVKFTPEGGALGLEVVGDAQQQTVHFTVWDTGIGIATENMGKLFQAFMQLDSRLARQYSGTGLGLALVSRMAELHGGNVSLESEIGRGSRFTITLPWHETAPTAGTNPLRPWLLTSSPLKQALTIEDSPAAAEQITQYLNELQVANVVHPVGLGVVERVLQVQPSIILLDLYLPEQSGWEVLKQLKADPRTRAIPVVIVSVYEDQAQAKALGAAGYLVKPFNRPDIQRVLAEVVPHLPQGSAPPVLVVAAAPTPASEPPRHHILLAEDNETTIGVMVDLLTAEGYAVSVARDGNIAVTMARQVHPHLILMDVQMPGIDGLEATRLLRRDAEFRQTPIIALTALAMPGDRERCLAAGANEYLTKPVNLPKLFQLIKTLIKPDPI